MSSHTVKTGSEHHSNSCMAAATDQIFFARILNLNKKLKREYFSEKITHVQGDLKKTRKTINQVINKKSNTAFVTSLKVDGASISDSAKIASSMKEFFCTIGDRRTKKIPDKPNPLLSNKYSIDTALPSQQS